MANARNQTKPCTPRTSRKSLWYFAILWIVSVVLQLWMAGRFRGYVGDQRIFLSWMQSVEQSGLSGAYQMGHINYPPIYPLILGLYGHLMSALHVAIEPGQLLIKLPGITIDALAMIVIFVASRHVSSMWRMFVLTLFCLNPAILFDTAVWGQIDILDGILAVLAILTLQKRPAWSGSVFAISLLSKFQSIVIAPVMLIHTAKAWVQSRQSRQSRRWTTANGGSNGGSIGSNEGSYVRNVFRQAWLRLILGMLVPFTLCSLYFAFSGGGLGTMVHDAYVATTGEYPYVSMNAMNIWFHLFGTNPGTSDTARFLGFMDYKTVGLCLLFLAVSYVVYYMWYAKSNLIEVLLKAATMVSFSFYMLPTEMHERYIVMGLMFSIFTLLYDKTWSLLALGLTLTSFCNLWAVNYFAVSQTSDMWMVYLNTIIFVVMVMMTFREIQHPQWFARNRVASRDEVDSKLMKE